MTESDNANLLSDDAAETCGAASSPADVRATGAPAESGAHGPENGGARPCACAWEGAEVTHANLVLEGGAMRGQFTAGVLDFFMDQKLFCERVIGVSAGALCGGNYVAGAAGRSSLVNVKYCTDSRYLSMQSFVRTGNAYGREFAFREIPDALEPFDKRAFATSPMTLEVVSTNLETGEADYHEMRDYDADLDYLIASSSMPLVSKIVDVDGKKLLDGGTADSVPLMHSLLTGAEKHIVVLTREQGYEKKPNKLMALMRQRYAEYPYYLDRLAYRHYEYNRVYRWIEREQAAGRIFVIRPEKPVEVSSMEHDRDKLLDLYEQGLAAAAKAWPALSGYLAE